MKYSICCLPRSGSYLASQLLEEYVIRKYGDTYRRIPYYEFLCNTTLKDSGIKSHAIIDQNDDIVVSSDMPASTFDHEYINRINIIDTQAKKGIYYINKLIYRSSPIEAFQYLTRNGYHFLFIERKNLLSQIISHAVASSTKKWHNDENSRNFKQRKSSDMNEIEWELMILDKKYVMSQLHYLHDMRTYYNWANHTLVYYEDFKDNYEHIYTKLGFTDYKDYIPNFDFITSTPTTKFNPEDVIENYNEVKQWVDDYSRKIGLDTI